MFERIIPLVEIDDRELEGRLDTGVGGPVHDGGAVDDAATLTRPVRPIRREAVCADGLWDEEAPAASIADRALQRVALGSLPELDAQRRGLGRRARRRRALRHRR